MDRKTWGIFFFFVWFAFCAPQLVAGFITGSLASSRLVAHAIVGVLVITALIGPLWSFDGSLVARLLWFLVWTLPIFALGAVVGVQLKPYFFRLTEIGSMPTTKRDWFVLVLVMAFPVFLATKVWLAEKSETEKLCDGKAKVDEACARSKCESEARFRIPSADGGRVDANRGSTSSIAEHELVQETFPSSASEAKYWVMRGVKKFFVPESSTVEGHRVFICYVNEKGSVWLKSSKAESDRYPAKGSALREAFESEWKR